MSASEKSGLDPQAPSTVDQIRSVLRRCHLPMVGFTVTENENGVTLFANIAIEGGGKILSHPWNLYGNQTPKMIARACFNAAASAFRTYRHRQFLFDGDPIFDEKPIVIGD